MSTIQVDEETKKKLLEIAGRLQAELKRNVTFNDAIKFLIDEFEEKRSNNARVTSKLAKKLKTDKKLTGRVNFLRRRVLFE